MSTVRKIGIFLFMLLVLSLLSCADDTKKVDENGVMNVDYNNGVMVRNGTAYNTYQLQEGEKGVIIIKITKTSGEINIDVYNVNNKNKPNYSGRDVELDYFTVNVSELGEYEVRIECFSFVGDYEINWKTEKTN